MLYKWFNQRVKHLQTQNDGATAIEFSLLAAPFMILIFGILELAIVFFTTTSLQHNLTSNTRSIRVGMSDSICGSIDDIKQDICDDLNVQGCLTNLNLNITRVNSSEFNAGVLSQFQANSFTVDEDDQTIDFAATEELATGITGNEILIAKAVYQHDLILPGQLTRLSNFGLNNRRIITVTQAIRTEPFPDVTCSG